MRETEAHRRQRGQHFDPDLRDFRWSLLRGFGDRREAEADNALPGRSKTGGGADSGVGRWGRSSEQLLSISGTEDYMLAKEKLAPHGVSLLTVVEEWISFKQSRQISFQPPPVRGEKWGRSGKAFGPKRLKPSLNQDPIPDTCERSSSTEPARLLTSTTASQLFIS
jgi:hypothetical protein